MYLCSCNCMRTFNPLAATVRQCLQIDLSPGGRDQNCVRTSLQIVFYDHFLCVKPVALIGDDKFHFVPIRPQPVEVRPVLPWLLRRTPDT